MGNKYDRAAKALRGAAGGKPSQKAAKQAADAQMPRGAAQQLPWEQRVAIDPNVRAAIDEAMPDLEAFAPEVAARVKNNEPGAVLEAYRYIVDRGGQLAPAKQMELPLGDEPTGLIPFGYRGPGVLVDPPESRALIPYSGSRGLVPTVPSRALVPSSGPPGRELALRDIPVIYARGGGQGMGPPRLPGGGDDAADWIRRNRGAIGAAAAGAGAAATGVLLENVAQAPEVMAEVRDKPLVPNIIRKPKPMSTADLAARTSPPPVVATPAPSPREQALELISKLNRMRREAGGEVPEAPAMQREIERLLALSNAEANRMNRGEIPVTGSGPRAQAHALIAQLNAMRRQAGGEVPQAAAIMREVNRLFALDDEQTNARTTAFPRGAR